MKQLELVQQHFITGLMAAGVTKANIRLQAPLDATFTATTGASITTVQGTLHYLNRPVKGTITHARKILWQCPVQIQLEISGPDQHATNTILQNLLIWMVNHPLKDPTNNEPIGFEDPMQLSWVDGEGTLLKPNRVILMTHALVNVFDDTELIDITVILQRRIDGGNPDE